jgi:hypothetical protein
VGFTLLTAATFLSALLLCVTSTATNGDIIGLSKALALLFVVAG